MRSNIFLDVITIFGVSTWGYSDKNVHFDFRTTTQSPKTKIPLVDCSGMVETALTQAGYGSATTGGFSTRTLFSVDMATKGVTWNSSNFTQVSNASVSNGGLQMGDILCWWWKKPGGDMVQHIGVFLLIAGAGDDNLYGDLNWDAIRFEWTQDPNFIRNMIDAPSPLLAGGADTLYCGAGDDRAWGGMGNDVLYGEDGNDIFGGAGVRLQQFKCEAANEVAWRVAA